VRDQFNWRKEAARVTLVLAIAIAALLIVENSHIPHPFLRRHQWLWEHSDDRSIIRILINSWMSSVVVWLISLIGAGSVRRKAFAISASNVVGFPLMVWLSVWVS
jgi:hypothetical protein